MDEHTNAARPPLCRVVHVAAKENAMTETASQLHARLRAVLSAAILLFLVTAPEPIRAAPDCGFKIEYSELVAVGAAHRDGLYLISVYTTDGFGTHVRFPNGYHFTAATDVGATGMALDLVIPPLENGLGSAMFLVVLPAPGVRWVTLDSVVDGGNSTICDGEKYVLPQLLFSTDSAFDDTVPALSQLPLITFFQPPDFSRKVEPNYPAAAMDNNLQGDVTVAVAIDATGKTTSVTVMSSSGHRLLDYAAADAARASALGASVLPAILGGKPIAMRFVIIYTFSLDE